ncbi:MAG: VCBS repeat-containing protein [Planctomycetota bacterium]
MQEWLRRKVEIGSCACALTALLAAQSSPPPLDPALRARFGFLGPRIVKVASDIGLLRVVDLDHDGRAEILLHDATHGHVERITLDGSDAIRRSSIDTRGAIVGLAAGDVRGAGSAQIVLLRSDGRVVVDPESPHPLQVEVGPPRGGDALRLADVDGDGRADPVVLTRDGLRCVTGLPDAPQVSPAIDAGDLPWIAFEVADVDGDHVADLVLGAAVDTLPIRVARGDGHGGFGPWLAFGTEKITGLFIGPALDGLPTLATLAGARRRLVVQQLLRSGGRDAIQLTSLPATKRPAFAWAVADFDGDGDLDLALAQADRAELTWLLDDGGRFHAVTVPSFVGITSLAAGDVDSDGRTDLLLASPDEKALAWHSGATDLAAFPERIATGVGDPVTVGIGPDATIHCILRDRSKNAVLVAIRRLGDAFGEAATECKVGRVGNEPLRLLFGEFDATPGIDVAWVVPGEGLRLARNRAAGGFQDVDPKSDEGASFAERIEDGAFGLAPREGATAAMLVLRDRFARIFRLDARGQPEIFAQRNVPPGADGFDVGAIAEDGVLAAIERRTNLLHLVARDGNARSIPLPPIGPTHVLWMGEDIVVLGRSGVVRIRRGDAFELRERGSQDPPTDDARALDGVSADLDADGQDDIALLDSDLHGVQVHVGPSFSRGLAFPVFERAGSDADLREPRAVAAGDVDGDGRADLVLIAFDRVLVYLQEKPGSDR